MARILIVDDDAAFRAALGDTLRSLGHEVSLAPDGKTCIESLAQGEFSLAFIDYRMPDLDGLQTLRRLREAAMAHMPPIVMLTAFASSQNTIEAMTLGAFDHLPKPIGRQELAEVVQRALSAQMDDSSDTPEPAAEPLIGGSVEMRELQKQIGRAAATDFPVLICGETGTGKELVARALHGASKRSAQVFVAVNCAALPAELMESELFGHRKGAFSGAVAERLGTLREAEGGSVFLDEIGDMPLTMQAKLLRVLQEREVTPLGSSQPVPIDIRIVAASHRDLPALAREGTFRSDLLYRLNVVPLNAPPLRFRIADILPLAEHFLGLAGHPPKRIAPDAARVLVGYSWPGNVRELKNLMERCQVLVRGARIEASDLEPHLERATPLNQPDASATTNLTEAVAQLEQHMIRDALTATGGNRTEAARRLGIHRQLLYKKMAEHGLT